jgi:hypothetical protein
MHLIALYANLISLASRQKQHHIFVCSSIVVLSLCCIHEILIQKYTFINLILNQKKEEEE